jgi:hypothetical protein
MSLIPQSEFLAQELSERADLIEPRDKAANARSEDRTTLLDDALKRRGRHERYHPQPGHIITLPDALWGGNRQRLYEVVEAAPGEASVRVWDPQQYHPVSTYPRGFLELLGATRVGTVLFSRSHHNRYYNLTSEEIDSFGWFG